MTRRITGLNTIGAKSRALGPLMGSAYSQTVHGRCCAAAVALSQTDKSMPLIHRTDRQYVMVASSGQAPSLRHIFGAEYLKVCSDDQVESEVTQKVLPTRGYEWV